MTDQTTTAPHALEALVNDAWERRGEISPTSAGKELLQALATKPSPEKKRRLERLLDQAQQGPPHKETLRAVRAIEVLERTNTVEARAVVEAVSKGDGRRQLSQQANGALKRLTAQSE